jgi:pimeloyl-ACP methyl ester carboxylesterase
MKITQFKVDIHESDLEDLKFRINKTRWPDEISGAEWTYGTNLDYLREICQYWSEEYSWRDTEAAINAYQNYIAEIDGYKIHFIHIKRTGKPLMITHGWPGSFLEMLKLIPLLKDFDLVIPSIPGFGFSDKPVEKGCNSAFVAELWHKLMIGLGYTKYGLQGGDIGAGISSWLTMRHPEHVTGLHLNYIPGSYLPYSETEETPEVMQFKQYASKWAGEEAAYSSIQSTKPQTLAYGLNDSPAGLCAWILEKFYSWMDEKSVVSRDEILGNISLYWLTQTLPSAVRMYKENRSYPLIFKKADFIKTPVAFAKFPKELPTPPRSYIEKGYNIQQWTEMPVGGHFAALEQPQLLSDDISNFFMNVV